jgi:ubiquinone biosynthesis protein UbiJ
LQAVAQDDDPGNGKDRRMNDKEHIKQLQKLLADQKAETARVTAERDELQAALDQIAAMATRP